MYDCLIIGAGPAGISAAIYVHRFGYKPVIIGTEYGGAMSEPILSKITRDFHRSQAGI